MNANGNRIGGDGGGNGGDGANGDRGGGGADERTVRTFVRSGRTALPAAVDARLAQALRGPAVEAEPVPAGATPRRWLAAALVAAGIAVTVAVFALQREGRDARDQGTPAQDPQRAPQQPVVEEPPPLEELEGPAPQDPAGPAGPPMLRVLDAERTLQRAPLLLVVDVSFPHGKPADGRLGGEVLRVLHGSGVEPGRKVELRFARAGGSGDPTMLDVLDLAQLGEGFPGPWLLALQPAPEQPEDRPFQLVAARGTGMPGVPVLEAAPKVDADATALDRVRAELAAALASPRAGIRAAAVEALCRWDGSPLERNRELLESSPWADEDVARTLLRLADDGDPAIRLALAQGIPLLADGDAVRALERLCFDAMAFVRAAATNALYRVQGREWAHRLPATEGWWSEFTHPPKLRHWEGLIAKAMQREGTEGVPSRSAIFLRQLDKDRAKNVLSGALGLGTTGDTSVLPRLVPLGEHSDLRVRAAAARSRVQLGDRGGFDTLRALVADTDANGAVYALDMLRTLPGKEALDAIATAAKHQSPLVRAFAAAGLRERRAAAPHMVDALLGDLRQDEAEIVRIAARE